MDATHALLGTVGNLDVRERVVVVVGGLLNVLAGKNERNENVGVSDENAGENAEEEFPNDV